VRVRPVRVRAVCVRVLCACACCVRARAVGASWGARARALCAGRPVRALCARVTGRCVRAIACACTPAYRHQADLFVRAPGRDGEAPARFKAYARM